VVEIFFGLGFIFFFQEWGKMLGFEPGPKYISYIGALLGFTLITISGFIISAARNPLQYIGWVRFAIWWCIAGVVAGLYAVTKNYVDFSQAGMGIIWDGVVAVALLIFYPWRKASSQ
jgi:hypothetical protein